MIYVGVQQQSYYHVADGIMNQARAQPSSILPTTCVCVCVVWQGLLKTVSGDPYTTALLLGGMVLFVSFKVPPSHPSHPPSAALCSRMTVLGRASSAQ